MRLGADLAQRGHGREENHASARRAKAEMRRHVLAGIGPDRARVLDCFAGSGGMWRDVWVGAAVYAGCDTRWLPKGEHRAFVCDNRRLLRCLNLSEWNVFDLDARGAPWEQAVILAARRKLAPGEVVGLALTDGSMMRAKLGRVERNLARLAGIGVSTAGAHRQWEKLTRAALVSLAETMSARVSRMWAAEDTPRGMYYSAALFEGV